MGLTEFILLGLLLAFAVYVAVVFNNLVRLKHDVKKSWSNIDVLLKQRHDEIPKLVETCKGIMKHERETLEAVMNARSAVAAARQAVDVAALGPAEQQLRAGLGSLFAVAEAYPELKADRSFQHLQTRISGLEDAIADRREFFNSTVTNLNTRIEQFPDVFVANAFKFQAGALLQFDEAETADVDLGRLFG